MRVRINGKSYQLAAPAELSLRDLIELERVTTAMGMPVNLGILEEWQAEINAIKAPTKAERNRLVGANPHAQWMFAVNLYASRRKAGDEVTFDECLDMSPMDAQWEPEDGDEEPDPTGRPLPLKASAVAVKRPADRAKKSTRKASKRASTAA